MVHWNPCCDGVVAQVWQGDAVEFYLTDNLRDRQQNVTEIDISPVGGGLWASYINNSGGYFPEQPAVPIVRQQKTLFWYHPRLGVSPPPARA